MRPAGTRGGDRQVRRRLARAPDFYTSPGFANERVWLFLATELYDTPERRHTDERIEVVEFPLSELDSAIERYEDAKSLIGLLTLRQLI